MARLPDLRFLRESRPAPRPLEIEVFKRFQRWDSKYADERKKLYPQLVKEPPTLGAAGTGSVVWVGLNPDPCKAKHLAKSGRTTSAPSLRPASAPARGRPPRPEAQCVIDDLHDEASVVGSLECHEVDTACLDALDRSAALASDRSSCSSAEVRGHVARDRDGSSRDMRRGGGRQLPRRPTSAPPRSRHANRCAQILEKSGESALEQAALLRELRDNTDLNGSERSATPGSQPASGRRPASAERRKSSAAAPVARRPFGDLTQKKLSQMNCNQHYLEQKLGLSASAPGEAPLKPHADPAELLYSGVSHEGAGRWAYLKERHKLAPQEKYPGPVTSTDEVGWQLGDPYRPLRPPVQKCFKERPSMIVL